MAAPKITGRLLSVILLAIMAGLLMFQHQSLTQLREDNKTLRRQTGQLCRLQAENARLTGFKADAEELERLRREHGELLRLRGEATLLRQQLRQQTPPPPNRAATPSPAPAGAESPVHTFSAAVQATVGNSQTLVTGGWSTKPGKRVLVFVTPQLTGADQTGDQILFKTMLVEAPEDSLKSAGLEAFKADTKESSLQGILGAQDFETVLKTLRETAGVDILSAPSITTLDGRQAQVAVTNLKTVPGTQEQIAVGPMINLMPRLSADRASVDLTVQAQLNLLHEPSE